MEKTRRPRRPKVPEGWVAIECRHEGRSVVLGYCPPNATIYSPVCRDGRMMRPHAGPAVEHLAEVMQP